MSDWYGRSVADIYRELNTECNFLWNCVTAEEFTREKIIWLLMQK